MATSSKRWLTVFWMLNIIIGIVGAIVLGASETEVINRMDRHIMIEDERSKDFVSEESVYGGLLEDNSIEGKSIGNPLSWGINLLNVMKYGFGWFTWGDSSILGFTTLLEKLLWNILGLFRAIIGVLTAFEIFLIWKNNKVD